MKKRWITYVLICLMLTANACGNKATDIENQEAADTLFEQIPLEDDSNTENAQTDDTKIADENDTVISEQTGNENTGQDDASESEEVNTNEQALADDSKNENISDDKDNAENVDASAENSSNNLEQADASAKEELPADEAVEESSEETGEDLAENKTEEQNAGQSEAVNAVATQTPHTGGHIVVIDPGHQSKAMTDKEPNGPGSSTMKMKVTGGTSGRTTGLAEYQMALDVGLKLKAELTNRGYTVIMTRESNDVSLSNVDRAQIANNAGAEAFVRLHGNGSDDSSVNGAMTICQTPSNPYNGAYYSQSRKLSDCVLDAFVAATGCKKQYVWETDTMTGINWANVPSTIIEMGYMTNPTEDTNMASESYQTQMVLGIANGIDNFFAN
ncbi:N-acetylmuramoyl-L-alanine amidase family protein [Butyrivibrio sp. AE3004]|uniref:N-acetylmuramoyl-L-alanine amidase family protein n=1 Tax=Butyrivibrio sp. AE3004 TaxID=1506994 RepID=UPI0004947534|nr:N-acetylmuramoyl-L-alanine amidase [Butyrivibrio sp. AE3004]